MSSSDIERLIEISRRLHSAIVQIIEQQRKVDPVCVIPSQIEHPTWAAMKGAVHSSLMLWQVAYLLYPYVDKWRSQNPLASGNYFNKRNILIYYLIDAVENRPDKITALPPTIDNIYNIEKASIADKVQIKINISAYKFFIENGLLHGKYSGVYPLWLAWMKVAKQKKMGFTPSPEPVHIQGYFNSKPYYAVSSVDEDLNLYEQPAPERMKIERIYLDSFTHWQQKSPWVPEREYTESMGRLIKTDLAASEEIGIQPNFSMGDSKPDTIPISAYQAIIQNKNKRPSTEEKDKERAEIYEKVRNSSKGYKSEAVLIEEAAALAKCSPNTMRRALKKIG